MKERKYETFIYEDLGFPIELTNAPMKKIFGEWVLDINLNKFQIEVLHLLIYQQTPLQAGQLRFIRKYFEMTTTNFGKILGVSHVAVLKWESGQLPSPAIDIYIRMYVMERLSAKNEEFGELYHQISLASLAHAKSERKKIKPLILNARKLTFPMNKV